MWHALGLQTVRSLAEGAKDLVPIVRVIAVFQLAVPGQPLPDLGGLLCGTLLVVVGLTLFVQVRGWRIQYLIIGGYVGVVVITAFAPREIVGIS